VLQGADAVAFVADSRRSEAEVTRCYWDNMLANLEANDLDPRAIPIVVQLNKRDLADVRAMDELADLRAGRTPLAMPAVAVRGEGVVETFHALLSLTYRNLDAAIGLGRLWRVPEDEFLSQVFSHVDLRGTGLERVGAAP
jgi:signal recognition particle receptor subunit beta